MNVAMWKHCTFDSLCYWHGEVYCSNPIIIINLLLPIVRLKLFSVRVDALTSKKFSCSTCRSDRIHSQVPSSLPSLSYGTPFLPTICNLYFANTLYFTVIKSSFST